MLLKGRKSQQGKWGNGEAADAQAGLLTLLASDSLLDLVHLVKNELIVELAVGVVAVQR
jgi:hypothetical protein